MRSSYYVFNYCFVRWNTLDGICNLSYILTYTHWIIPQDYYMHGLLNTLICSRITFFQSKIGLRLTEAACQINAALTVVKVDTMTTRTKAE